MKQLIAALFLLVSFAAQADTVAASWQNAATNTNSTLIPASGDGSLVRTVVEYGTRTATGVFGVKVGEIFVAAPATSLQVNLVVAQEYALRAFHCNTYATTFAAGAPGCSGFSNLAFYTVVAPTPAPPANLTVSSTLVGSAGWTCRTPAGNVISSHTRQDKAQESCTNMALANVGTPYEIHPGGVLRVVAR